MFTRLQQFYNSVKWLADVAALSLAFWLALTTRFSGVPEELPPPGESFLTWLTVVIIFPITFRQANLYTTNRARSHFGEVFEVFRGVVLGTLLLVAITYFTRERYSRLTLALFSGYALLSVSAVRLAFRFLFNELRRRGLNRKHILVVGDGELAARVIDTIHGHRELGFEVTGVLGQVKGDRLHGVPVVGAPDQLGAVLDSQPVDQVLIALPAGAQGQLGPLMDELALRPVDVKVVPDLLQYVTLRGGLEDFGGLPIISLQGGPLHGWNLVLKRAFDLVLSALALVVLSPLMLGIAVLVKLSSRGPVFFAQERMGMDGRVFRMYKFRTMRVDAEAGGARFASKDDPRRTWAGAFLRRSSLDELPQFFNVLVGDMSLVGPRPERPVFIEEFKKQIPRYHLRHLVKAGITGWAQVNGLRGDTSIKERIDYDLYYIENWSLTFDLAILVRTALGGFVSRNAY